MNGNLPPPKAFYVRAHRVLGPCFHRLGVSCRHFAELTLRSMDQRLTLRERIRRRLHFFSCSVCRGFQKQMLSLTALVRMSVSAREAEQPDPDFLRAVRSELTRVAGESDQNGSSNTP
jgi:hypothetical protein